MNRSERRRQEAKSGANHQGSTMGLRNLLEEGKVHQQAGRLADAERLYRQALDIAPRQPEALHLLGLVLYRQQRFDEAISSITAAVAQQPSSPLYWFNLGVISQKGMKSQEAITAYQKAIALHPRYLEALVNMGNVLREEGRFAESIETYQKALVLNPSQPETLNNLGVALKEHGHLDQAIASYRQALVLKPTHIEALNNLGLALMEAGTLRDAIDLFQQALSIRPGYQKALYNLGIAWSWVGDDAKAVDCFMQVARAKHDHGKPVVETSIYRSRIKHDVEQVAYLLGKRRLNDDWRSYLASMQQLQHALEHDPQQGNRLSLSQGQALPVAPSFNRILFCLPPPRIAGGALNPALDVESIEARYFAKQPEVTFIDGLLNREALVALREFCLEATIWKKDYENGYSGAFLGDGFASPLLFQIAEELRLKLPRIFKHHRLTQAWAFKHDSARRGLNIHADAAAVNVNFWITPDEANLNPETGGLIVYDREAPKEWNFRDYNSAQNKPKIVAWLQEVGARAVRIPYRANRAVLFNSDLFHETDEICFKDDYESRRINVTLLYGYRMQE